MARTYWLYGDLHFQHENMSSFLLDDGSIARPNPFTKEKFSGSEEHDEFLIEQWNSVVKSEGHTVYLLGDICINQKGLFKLNRLNGRKILVPGNHDIFPMKDYMPYFSDVRGYIVRNKIIYTHIPIHKDCMARFGCNVHAHTHNNVMKDIHGLPDRRYFCVSVEQCPGYKPISMDIIHAHRDKLKADGLIDEKAKGNA
jgi:calcineurin-like phosphoesterase family protein